MWSLHYRNAMTNLELLDAVAALKGVVDVADIDEDIQQRYTIEFEYINNSKLNFLLINKK